MLPLTAFSGTLGGLGRRALLLADRVVADARRSAERAAECRQREHRLHPVRGEPRRVLSAMHTNTTLRLQVTDAPIWGRMP
jgi:hypothetical protein